MIEVASSCIVVRAGAVCVHGGECTLATPVAVPGDLAPSGRALLRAHGENASLADNSCDKHLREYMAAGWSKGQGTTVVSCSFDAGRCGNPAESVEVFAAQCFGQTALDDHFLWLPPQAAVVLHGMSRLCVLCLDMPLGCLDLSLRCLDIGFCVWTSSLMSRLPRGSESSLGSHFLPCLDIRVSCLDFVPRIFFFGTCLYRISRLLGIRAASGPEGQWASG